MDPKIQALVDAWSEGQWEFSLAFEGLADTDLWTRPHPNLLSIGELAGHVAHNEAIMLPEGAIESPLNDNAFNYYPHQLAQPLSLDLTVEQVLAEVKRVHEAAKAAIMKVENFEEKVPWRDDWTWGGCLQYHVFHVAYHCGQAYSVRHIMGHETTDN